MSCKQLSVKIDQEQTGCTPQFGHLITLSDMKYISLIFILIAETTFAQHIEVEVLNSPDTTLQVTFPVDGTVFWGTQQHFQLDNDQSLKLPNTIETAGELFIRNNGVRYDFFIEPEQSYTIQLDPSNKERPLTITGPDADGHYARNALAHPTYIRKAKAYAGEDSLMSEINEAINHDMSVELQLFSDLLAKKKISPAFYKNAAYEIRYYYAIVTASVITNEYYKTTFNESSPYYSPVFKKEFEDAWPQLFEAYPLFDPAAATADNFYHYAHNYIRWYKLQYLPKKNGTFDKTAHKNSFQSIYEGFANNFAGTLREYLQARYLYNNAFMEKYQPELVSLYKQFRSSYPESVYLPYLQPEIDKIIAFHEHAKKALKPDQQIMDNYATIDSFNELLDHFNGETVFVDMWATWCGPCKGEFVYNNELKKFLNENNVKMLYISIDEDRADKQWRDMIKFYDLSGTHIRASSELRTEMQDKFWDGQPMAIPRYLIFKDGAVVEADALRPSNKKQLYEQIRKFL